MKVVLLSIVLISISFIGLGISIFFRKNGKFPETEIGKNKNMRRLGITCVKCDEFRRAKQLNKRRNIKIIPARLKLDLGRINQTL
jgi:hypothetical protein